MIASLLDTVLFVAVGFAVVAAFLFLYTQVTPYPEFKLINEGNSAAAISLSGALLGFMLPLCSIIAHTHSILDLLLWSAIGFVLQLAIYGLVRLTIGNLERKVEQGSVAAGIYLGSCSVGGGALVAACLIP